MTAVGVAERGFLVPDVARGMAEHVAQGVDGVLVAVAGGKLENGKVHISLRQSQRSSAQSRRQALVTRLSSLDSDASFNFQFVILNDRVAQKFVRRVVQRLCAAALSVPGARSISMYFPTWTAATPW